MTQTYDGNNVIVIVIVIVVVVVVVVSVAVVKKRLLAPLPPLSLHTLLCDRLCQAQAPQYAQSARQPIHTYANNNVISNRI